MELVLCGLFSSGAFRKRRLKLALSYVKHLCRAPM
jgi:hypothetical protein